ncbi:hypothetical protein HYH03_017288 [Edaphochlamys debaryana]|uniref:Thioredoxin domain-containing protein n=1 Tax=Edaphochlamys debaryana TaxID=47281 RepID=A0A836BQL5_9CHLO|nr:hypothetical protein HYH03_017288 [Edaphochlamys debaryana]|eukprot:KAG2483894.1 hypothetical protein HYH03_017288 [Edaphochlamys debaryana]
MFWVLIGCLVITVIVTVMMMYRMSSKASLPSVTVPPALNPVIMRNATKATASAPKVESFADTEDERDMDGPDTEAGKSPDADGGVVEEPFSESSGANMVYIYSTSCGWCDRFNPTWKDFADRYGGSLNLLKIEARSEEARKYNVAGYPTVLIERPNGSSNVLFNDDRTVENLLKFARAHEAS